jgi:S1-C subfamily serine protease
MFNLLLPLFINFVHYAGQRTLLPPTIGTVLPDLPAAAAGLLPGDVIVGFADQPIGGIDDLHRLLTDDRVGVAHALVALRRAEKRTVSVTPREHRA